ncbi:hypothetical protein O181_066185 [Austropuccinia psidii MF-1]|uniref:Uncharacterized protein n=1 Tax=Austropuccinia psidii MF-1 TaxID=1389203 RepID=A0A9Q3ENJ2_9BASI|nr:hypothetical protein [Austropuccinia psidii MF-1]
MRHQGKHHVNHWKLTSWRTARPQVETMMPPPPLPSPLLTLAHPHLIFSATCNSNAPMAPQDMPPMPPSTPLRPNPLSTAYHPYAQVLDP